MFSILFPKEEDINRTKAMSEITMHDLGMDRIIHNLTKEEAERNFITRTMSLISSDPEVIKFRCDIFEDILNNPQMRESVLKILDRVNFLKDYGGFKRGYDESAVTTWDLMHRLDEINDYIKCIEALNESLSHENIKSEGLLSLKKKINEMYEDRAFGELREDIGKLKMETSKLKSVTVGINLNSRFEADSIGLISVNSKYFTKSSVIGNFLDKLTLKDEIKDSTDGNSDFKYHEFEVNPFAENTVDSLGKFSLASAHPIMAMSLATVPEDDKAADIPRYMNRETDHMLALTVRKLKDTLRKYVSITITEITNLIPEFVYYITWAEYIEKMKSENYVFSKASPVDKDKHMKARGIYNMKLSDNGVSKEEIVVNDLDFSKNDCVYILTGANRGGKTTITQAIGQLFVMAQGGIYIPGEAFEFNPVDMIYTHFPADEDQTMDLGRLGEECKRFKSLYNACTQKSLFLLNETFSTTSFEEGYFIARDSVRAILQKGIRTIYNTHMHKLSMDIEELNQNSEEVKASSLIVVSKDKERSFKIKKAAPEGMSYAGDIAQKYGVTYEMLIEDSHNN